MPDLGRYGSREILNLQIFDFVSSTPLMYFDYANTATFSTASSRVYAWGAGTRRIAWDGEKELTLTMETQIFTMEHLALIAGSEIESGASDIYKAEVLTVGSGKTLTLSKAAIGTVAVFPYVNGVIDKTQPQAVQTVAGTTVTLNSGASANVGDEVQVFYQYSVSNAHKVSFTVKGFPKYVKMVGDTLYSDEVSGDVVNAQMVYHKAKVQPNIEISSSSQGDPASISLVFDLFPVRIAGKETLVDMIIYDEDE